MKKQIFQIKFFNTTLLVVLGFLLTQNVFAFDQNQVIYLNQSYDLYNRSSINITQIKATNVAIFYADIDWWNNLSLSDQNNLQSKVYLMSSELEYKIKPTLNNIYGKEPDPIRGTDKRVNIILTPMINSIDGYIKTDDFMLRNSTPFSNEGNIIYLSANKIKLSPDNIVYSFLAHEFTHLITYNQKYLKSGAHDDIWLEELRAEYSPTLLGYNQNWDSSYLRLRAADFIKSNIITLSNWDNISANYAFVNLFAHYLVEQYGQNILFDSFNSPKTGIDSINDFLKQNGKLENFDQVFQNWLIANILNDCSLSTKYCYQNPNLKNITIIPISFYLPMNSNSTLAISDTLIPYMAKYQKISGGIGDLNFNFENPTDNLIKKIPYIVTYKDGSKKLFFLDFQKSSSQTVVIPNFSKDALSFIVIPYLVRSDQDYTNRSIFKWKAEINNFDTGTPQSTDSSNASTSNVQNTTSTTTDLANVILRQAKIIELQNKLIVLMQQLIALLLAR